ncbi:MAG: mechanosensitive ion channel family protein [Bacteroidales bacterium]
MITTKTQRRHKGHKAAMKTVIIVFMVFACSYLLTAQTGNPAMDSITKPVSRFEQLSSKTKVLAAQELEQRKVDFVEHQAVIRQSRHFVLIKKELEKARNVLAQGLESDEIYEEINELNGWRTAAGEGVVTNKDKFQTVRNLTTTSILLHEILNRTNNRLQKILVYHNSLGKLQYRLDSLLMDSILYHVPGDSVALARYFQKLTMLKKDLEPVSKPLKAALDSVQKIEIKVNTIKFGLESDIAETESQRKELFEHLGIIEKGSFGLGVDNQTTKSVIFFSFYKAWMVLVFYIFNHFNSLILMVLFVFGIGFYVIMLKRRGRSDAAGVLLPGELQTLSHPFASSTILVVTVFQLFLPMPPFVFSGLLWLTCGIALSIIMRKMVTPLWYRAWLIFYTLFLFGFAGNLLLRQSVFERWTMLFFIFSGLASGMFFLIKIKRAEIREKLLLLFIVVLVLFEILALINYFSGGYNQAKTFMITGVFAVVVAYYIYWATRIGNHLLQISYSYQKNGEDDHGSSAEKANKKTPLYYYFLFFIAWFILISRNFYFYQTMFEPMGSVLTETQTIGAFSFTYKSVFIFFIVLIISGIVSQVVSFLAADNTLGTGKSKASGLGSWMLLIRISIITIGVLLAFVSAGIPMDRFAMILGALSVGIGFGLQTLINNLVSGLIIAFEKPINVGDIVEITGQVGKMKSIGIRSSVVTTWDGADVIIPNGDLLNQHLVNWTLGSTRRRFDLLLGVAYGTNLEKTTQLLLDLMLKDLRILKNPQPIVLATHFNNSSVDLALKFWVPHFSIGFDVKSDLILAIDVLFRENGIVIPFPQQDVHILSTISTSEQKDLLPGGTES